jgi:hypothetical protein
VQGTGTKTGYLCSQGAPFNAGAFQECFVSFAGPACCFVKLRAMLRDRAPAESRRSICANSRGWCVQKVNIYHKEAGKVRQGHKGFSPDFRNRTDPVMTRTPDGRYEITT